MISRPPRRLSRRATSRGSPIAPGPGRYVVGPVRISYAEAGHLGWQDQYPGTTMVISAARPSQKPVFDSC
jgi:hypothetical protein